MYVDRYWFHNCKKYIALFWNVHLRVKKINVISVCWLSKNIWFYWLYSLGWIWNIICWTVSKSFYMSLGTLIIQTEFQFWDWKAVERIAKNSYLQYFWLSGRNFVWFKCADFLPYSFIRMMSRFWTKQEKSWKLSIADDTVLSNMCQKRLDCIC